MNVKQPLSDAWLYWDPERVNGYPHTSDPEPEEAQPAPRGDIPFAGKQLRLSMFEDLLLYVAGIASALVGVALAVLLGSFISAYSMLNDFGERARQPIVPYPAATSGHTGLLADATASLSSETLPRAQRDGEAVGARRETDTLTAQTAAAAVK